MVRAIFSVVAGLIVAVGCVYVAEVVVHSFHPTPPGFDMRDPDSVRALVAGLPLSAFLLVLAGWILAAGLGAWIAVRMNRRAALWPGVLVGALVFAATLYNIITIPHPIWFAVAGLAGILIATAVGARLGYGSGPALPTTAT